MFAFLFFRLEFPTRRLSRAAAATYLALTACTNAGESPAAAPGLVDDYGVAIGGTTAAQRIISLNPTTTEILFALGAGERVIGRSRWDQWPVEARTVPEVGDAIRPSVERILAARPDLVVLYASGDNRAAASALSAAGIAVVALRIDRLADFDRAVRTLGLLTGLEAAADAAIDSVGRSLAGVREAMRFAPRPRVFVHVWDNPLMAIGGGSYLSELIEIAGGHNVYAERPEPSPQVSFEDLVRLEPQVILAAPAEAARLRTDARWVDVRAVREGRVLAYDTTLVARPSMRLGEAARALALLLHPGAVLP
ncbi:MAG: ABC transporter substrate-binding protein [Gemmatimonadaceae bacterium]|nr:ABC transporter substrate-binding protein [Gemmatimonadaceae bacterium]